ncbi:MAG: DNA polymerase III subunit alpha [Myxococcota bacterium]
MAFAHLHVHSQFTLLNGVPSPKDLAKAAKGLGMDALALTDTCNLYGAVTFYKACKDAGIHPIYGAEMWVDPRGIASREGLAGAHQVVLLVEDDAGYKNLCKLITRAIFDGIHYRPRIDLALLREHNQGLMCLTAGESGVIRRPSVSVGAENDGRIVPLAEIFGADRLFCELMDQGLDWQGDHNVEVRRVAAAHGLRTVVANDVRYLKPRDAVSLDLLNSIAMGASLNDAKRPRAQTDQLYLKSEEEMRALFPDDGPALDLAHEIAHRGHFKFNTSTYYFPASTPPDPAPDADTDANWAFFYQAFPPPIDFGMPLDSVPPRPETAGSLNGYYCWYARQGLKLRLTRIPEEKHPPYFERLEFELKMIIKMGFAAYLLIVAEFINWAKDRAIPVGPGRGSAAGSLVAYAMRITDIDPVRFELLFERFLNPERISMPDIDVDFAQDRREEVIEHVRQKYTPPLVSQIITYGKLQAKAALRDAARVCDLSFQEADRLSKLVPNVLNITLADALTQEPKIVALLASDPKARRVYALATRIEGLARQVGVHAAGVVVADRPLVELAPLYRDGPEGGPVVQYDMKSAESIGLIKFDFLGLKTLDQIRDAVAMIERNTGERIDMSEIDDTDLDSWKLFQKGDGLGVFQVESSGMRDLLTRLRPSCLDDLIALVALFRPGPLSSGMVDDFIDRKHGRKQVEYPFEELKPVLQSTYGTIVYQEQVMQIAQVLAGYSLGEADLLRRAMGKKDAAEMQRQKTRFMTGAVAKGFDQQKVSDLFDLVAKFAEYGFNKSHSAAYGYVAYQTGWLKAHHRAEYMAALMSIDAGDSDKILVYVGDCRRAGMKILPPDINASAGPFDVPRDDRKAIRYGLHAVKGVGESAVASVVEARVEAGGRFKDFMDCLNRLDYRRVNRRVLESFIKCGAFDSLGDPRARLMAALEDAMAAAQHAQAEKASGQVNLFGGAMKAPSFKLPKVAEWAIGERMKFEKETLGLFLTGHPIEAFAEEVARFASAPIDGLRRIDDKSKVAVAGIVSAMRVIRTQKGDKMAFVTLEDMNGSVECLFFPKALPKAQAVLEAGRPVLLRGTVEQKADETKVLADTAEWLEDLRERSTGLVELSIQTHELEDPRLAKLQELLEANRGVASLKIWLEEPGLFKTRIGAGEGLRVAATPRLVEGLRALFGRADALRLS